MKVAEALEIVRGDPPCKVCALLDTLERNDRDALDDLLVKAGERPPGDRSGYGVGVTTVVKVLQENDHPIGRVWVERHVRGKCS